MPRVELATIKVDVAGFDRWLPEPAYERAVADDDLPEEVTKLDRPLGAYLRENVFYTFGGFNYPATFLN